MNEGGGRATDARPVPARRTAPGDARAAVDARAVDRRTAWAVFAVVALLTLARGTAKSRYDAASYWLAAQGTVGPSTASEAFWELRGVLSSVVYAPAAALSGLGVDLLSPRACVLLQNALFIAWFAAFLVPRFLRTWVVPSARTRWVAAGLVWAVTVGFASFALVDLYAAVGCIVVAVLLQSAGALPLLGVGLVTGAVLNVRPAYLLVLVPLVVAALLWHRARGLLVVAGVGVALLPQVVVNATRFGTWDPWPVGSSGLQALQAGFAAYVVRYDTAWAGKPPQQFSCSPTMARAVGDDLPQSVPQLAVTLLTELPHSLLFSLEKVGAALHWPLSSPYLVPTPGLDVLAALATTTVTAVGLTALVRLAVRAAGGGRRGRLRSLQLVVVCAIVVGTVLTLVSSATETRFALPLVLLGVVGTSTLVGTSPRRAWADGRGWVVAAVVLAAALVLLGHLGLSHPAPPGGVDPAICAVATG